MCMKTLIVVVLCSACRIVFCIHRGSMFDIRCSVARKCGQSLRKHKRFLCVLPAPTTITYGTSRAKVTKYYISWPFAHYEHEIRVKSVRQHAFIAASTAATVHRKYNQYLSKQHTNHRITCLRLCDHFSTSASSPSPSYFYLNLFLFLF